MDDGLHVEPGKGWIPLRQQQRMPQAAHTPISISERVKQFQFIVEHTATNQHVHLASFYPVQQFHNQVRDILWKGAEMQDIPFAVYYAHGPGTKRPGLFLQSPRHNAMGSQQIVHRIGIKFIQPLINLVGVLDLDYILR